MSTTEWFSVQSLAGCALMPATEQGVRFKARKENWTSRKRTKGKGYEYHISSLPAETQRALKISQTKKALAAQNKISDVNDAQLKGKIAGYEQTNEANQIQIRQAMALNELSPKEQQRVRARKAVLTLWETFISDFDTARTGTAIFLDAYNGHELPVDEEVRAFVPKVSRNVLYRWKSAYADKGPAALANQYKGVRQRLVAAQPELLAFAEGMVAKMPHITPKNLSLAMEAEFDGRDDIQVPSVRSVQSWLAHWKAVNQRLFTAVSNPDKYKNKYMTAGGSASEQVVRLNQLWEMDSSPADLMCTDGRFSLIACLDVYSRRAVLMVRKTSDAFGVGLTMRKAMLEWGLDGDNEQTIRVDNGADYKSHYVQMVADTLGIQMVNTAPYAGEQKPFVERFFKTFSHGLLELHEGFIGHSVEQGNQIKAQFSFADRLQRAKGSKALVTVSESSADLQAFCDDWVENHYMHEEHGGLKGKTPHQMVANWLQPVRRITDERALDVLLEPIPGNKGERTVQKKGIALDNGWYQAPALGRHVGDRLMVRYDPADAGRIFLFSLDGPFIATAENPELTGVSREELARGMKKEQKATDGEAKKLLKQQARKVDQKTVVQKIMDKKRRENPVNQANVTPLPKRALSHETDYLAGAREAIEQQSQDAAAQDERTLRQAQEATDLEKTVAIAGYIQETKKRRENLLAGLPEPKELESQFKRWKVLEQMNAEGKTLSEFELHWMEWYEGTTNYKAMLGMYESFGESWLKGIK